MARERSFFVTKARLASFAAEPIDVNDHAAPRLCEIRIEDVEIFADIGINPGEINRPQPLLVSVRMRTLPFDCDDIEATIDYDRLVSLARTLGGERISLIETFALRLARQCAALRKVLDVEVEIRKPRALASGIASVRILLDGAAARRGR